LSEGAGTTPRVSVLLPVRDGAATLRAALDSLHAQTFRGFRVVVVDDGSADETPQILREEMLHWGAGLAETPAASGGSEAPRTGAVPPSPGTPGMVARRPGGGQPFLTVVRLDPGAGIAGALVAGAQAAGQAELIARQDADDVSHPQRLARQVEFLDAHPQIGLVATGVRTVGAREGSTDGWRRYERWLAECATPEEIARELWIESPLPHPTVMMRRTAYDAAGGYREVPWAEDYDLWLRMLRAGIAMAKIPEPLYDWTDRPDRATRVLPAYTPEAFHACRAHHLARHLDGRGVIIWGAGRDGRRAARAMLRQGVDLRSFLDIDPRKIGRTAYGRPILSAEEWLGTQEELLGSGGAEFAVVTPGVGDAHFAPPIVLAAVGTAGARALIRARLVAAGLREGPDFLCIA
jgi:glycosyltransferase involved in cell wall biosynthesis